MKLLMHFLMIILYIMENMHKKWNALNFKLVDIEPIK